MANCIFCEIVKGEIVSYKIYEDENYLAFLDISQIVDGHTLLIPKKHVRWVWEIEDLGGYYKIAQRIVKKMQEATGEEFVSSVTLGVMVEHAHLHLLPKTEGSIQRVWDAWTKAREARKLEPVRMKELAEKFRV